MRNLLLADDSITVQRVIALTFAEEQIRVVTVADGQQAIEKMAAQRPDIVLAGTTLPKVSGYDLARFIRSKPELQHVPVLLLSGAFESVDAARLKASGANGILEKPVEPTIVIGRVKELLGLKGDAKPPASGRLVTPATAPAERTTPVATPPRAVTSTRGTPSRWDQLRDQTGLEPNTRSVEDSSTRGDNYLETLDAAFDTLDQQLSGRAPAAKPQRNPSGPLGQASGAPDPRSPGRSPHGAPQEGNRVFEVDEEWFGGTEIHARADVRADRDIAEELNHPELRAQPAPAAPANPIYEVDDEWFAENEKARAERLAEQQRLAAEMGIADVELPAPAAGPPAPAFSADDLRFSMDDIAHIQAVPGPVLESTAAPSSARAATSPPNAPAHPEPLPAAIAPLPSGFGREMTGEVPRSSENPGPSRVNEAPKPKPVAGIPKAAPPPLAETPKAPQAPAPLADDFAALLAFEQGEPITDAPAPEVEVVAPEMTDDMLDQIAARVAERLSATAFGDQLKDAMAATVKDTVRRVVSETSERLVRDEIERIKSRHKS